MKEKKKEGRMAAIVVSVLYMICCMFIGGLSSLFFSKGASFLEFLFNTIISLFGAFVIYLIHTVVHEFGHMVMGLATGYKFLSFRIFNIMWQRDEDGKIRMYNFSMAGTGGQCIMEPPKYKGDNADPYFWYNFGGILFNAIVTLMCLVSYIVFRNANSVVKYTLLIFVDIGIFDILVNGLPLKGINNDGGNILMFSKSKEAIKSMYIQMMGVALLKKGVRVKDFPEEWFSMPSDEELKNSMCTANVVCMIDRLFDRGEYEKVAETVEMLFEKDAAFASIHREVLKGNLIFYYATKNDIESAKKYNDSDFLKFANAMKTNPAVLRTLYTYELLVNENEEKANKILADFEKAAKTYPYPVEVEAEREAMDYAKGKQGRMEKK